MSGSGTQDLVLYSASQWKESVLVLDRDCTIANQLATGNLMRLCVESGECKTESDTLPAGLVMSKLPRSLVEEWVVSSAWDAETGCVLAAGATSVIPQALLNTNSSLSFRSVAGAQQAFSFAGDTTLTAVRNGAGEYSIRVDRLYGSERNEFSMVTVRKSFPAISPDPDQVFSSEQELEDSATPIPPVFNDMSNVRHPSVATRTSVYFVVNPSLSMFKGFASYCESGGASGRLQLSALSSYAAIRVFRIDPYGYCASGDDGSQECSEQTGVSVKVPGGYFNSNLNTPFHAESCQEKFSVSVTGMEVLDDYNIVLTVLNASLTNFDLGTGRLIENATGVTYDLLYMHPELMAISDTPFTKNIVSATNTLPLCPAMRKLPCLGSLVSEPMVIIAQIVRFAVSLITSIPGIVQQWQSGRKCHALTHGHTLLQGCSEELFLMTEFWRSLIRSNQIFWSVFGYVSGGLREIQSSRIAEVVDGVAYFGEATSIPSDLVGLAGVIRSVQIPTNDITSGILSAVVPIVPQVFTKALSGNPIKVAQFSYNILATTITKVVALDINDELTVQKVSLVFMDQLHEGRDQFYESVVKSINSGCSGLSLMIGYANPWGALVRKSCEAAPLAVVGMYDLILSIFSEIPVISCMCVSSRKTGTFANYALDHCYPKVPAHMRSLVLLLIETARISGDMDAVCNVLVSNAGKSLDDSMTPFFAKAVDAAKELSSSFDYLFTTFGDNAGRCLDFEENRAGAVVLIPEPYDYFSSCALTSFCGTLCSVELEAFKKALSLYEVQPTSIVRTATIDAPFFSGADSEDSYMPMHIVAVAELTGPICPSNARAMGVAGVNFNGTLAVKKFCLPKVRGVSVYHVPLESWTVWFSEDWAETVVDMQFADVFMGDSLVILRDGSGYTAEQATIKGPDETFLSIHTRMSQQDVNIWRRYFFTPESRVQNQMLAQGSSNVASRSWTGIAITDLLVQPIGMTPDGTIVVAFRQDVYDGSPKVVSKSVCASFSLATEANLVSIANGRVTLSECQSLNVLFENIKLGYNPVVYGGGVWLIPTKSSLDLLRIPFITGLLSDADVSVVVPSHGMFGQRSMGSTFQSWNKMSRGLLSGLNSLTGQNAHVVGQSVTSDFGSRMSQNTLSTLGGDKLEFLVSGNPGISTHWVSLASVTMTDGGVTKVRHTASFPSDVTLKMGLRCDRESCLGCPTTALLTLCYALRQCAIVNCVGTTTSLRRPLCNIGLLAQTSLLKSLEHVHSAWRVFVETYKSVLNLATRNTDSLDLDWVDDAFFGHICLAKNQGGELSALLMSFFGAVIDKTQKTSYVDLSKGERVVVDSRKSARSSMIFAGTTSMLFQLSLAPLYTMIVMQKVAVCRTSHFFATVLDEFQIGSFTINVGSRNLSKASDVAVGTCMTSFFENEVRERPSGTDVTALSTNLIDAASTAQDLTKSTLNSISAIAGDVFSSHIQTLYHAYDATFTYFMGVISGAQDMAQAIDEQHCRLPDYYMYRNMECGCNDTPVRVVEASRKRSTHAYWCKGSLQLTDSFGKQAYVVNPYTYDELVGLVEANAREHLRCLSQQNADRITPCPWTAVPGLDDLPVLESITSIAVLQKCRKNFLLKEWDEGAFYQFQGLAGVSDEIDQCILAQYEIGDGPGICLDDFLLRNNITKEEYFAYEATDLNTVDACIVASGPAKSTDETIAQKFLPCVQDPGDCGVDGTTESCQFPMMVWEGLSSNRVPVSYQHLVGESDMQSISVSMVECAKNAVLAKLQEFTNYANANLEVVLFSAEGDALHQVCFSRSALCVHAIRLTIISLGFTS